MFKFSAKFKGTVVLWALPLCLKKMPSSLFRTLLIGIHAVSPEGFIKYANQNELDTLGYEEEEYVGHHISEFHLDAPRLADIMARLGRMEELHAFPEAVKGKHGMKYILYNSNVYQKNGEFIHTRCYGTEITKEVFDFMIKQSPTIA